MTQRARLPVTIQGYVPDPLEQAWCRTCGTMNGYRIVFVKSLVNTDSEAPSGLLVEGCFGCDARRKRAGEADEDA